MQQKSQDSGRRGGEGVASDAEASSCCSASHSFAKCSGLWSEALICRWPTVFALVCAECLPPSTFTGAARWQRAGTAGSGVCLLASLLCPGILEEPASSHPRAQAQ